MDGLNKKITDFHYGRFSLGLFILFFIPSFFYYLVISMKNFLYKKGFLKETKADCFVICAGNLTTGGVGKTPLVIEIANYFSKKGKKTVVLSRGYKGSLDNRLVNLIRTYDEIIIDDPLLSGDEANLISKKVENAAVITTKDRLKGAKYSKEVLGADVIILDDGYSNRKLFKDFNIILIDKKKTFGNGFCLPLGPLREPVCEIKRANAIVVVDKDGVENKRLDEFLSKTKIKNLTCKMETDEIYNIKTKEKLDKSVDIIAFSGIGQPESFYQKLNQDKLKKTITFDDHFEYKKETLDKINAEMKQQGAKAIVTTEKDMVKILGFDNIQNVYALKLKPALDLDELFKDVI